MDDKNTSAGRIATKSRCMTEPLSLLLELVIFPIHLLERARRTKQNMCDNTDCGTNNCLLFSFMFCRVSSPCATPMPPADLVFPNFEGGQPRKTESSYLEGGSKPNV